MATNDLFKRSLELWASLLDMTQQRAETLVKELVKAGEVRKGRTQEAIDELVARSRKTTDELRDFVGRELRQQITALGLATKADIGRLEARLDELAGDPARPARARPTGKATGTTTKMTPATTKAAGAKQASTTPKPGTRRPAPGAPAARPKQGAPIKKSASATKEGGIGSPAATPDRPEPS